MSRARIVNDGEGRFYGIRFDCPGCALVGDRSGIHVLPVDWAPAGAERSPHQTGAKWGFNGDLERPTLTPSVLSTFHVGPERTPFTCHSFVRDGQIQFLGDCTHALAGQTLDLPEVEVTP